MTAVFSAGPQSPPNDEARHLSLHELKRREEEIRVTFAKLEWALATGKISQPEYQYYVNKRFGGKTEEQLLKELRRQERGLQHERKLVLPKFNMVTAIFLVSALLAIGTLLGGGITGLSVYDAEDAPLLLNASGNLTLNETDIAGLAVSGTLSGGDVTITLLVGTQQHLVYHGTSTPTYEVRTDKESYGLNETVNITVLPANSTATVWVTRPDGAKELAGATYAGDAPGTYVVDALYLADSGAEIATTAFTVRNDTDPTGAPRSTDVLLDGACDETCTLPPTGSAPLTLVVELGDGASFTLIEVVTIPAGTSNRAPAQVAALPAITVAQGETVTLDLDAYFQDPDGDALSYDALNAAGASVTVAGSTLTVTGTAAGETSTYVFANDAEALIQSDEVLITVTPGTAPPNATNRTPAIVPPNSTPAPNATPATPTTPATPAAGGPPPGLCDHPNPDKRPVECLQEEAAIYFQAQPVYITDSNRNKVARFTPIGNLLLTGDVHENSAFTPRDGDYIVGYEDPYGAFHATVWFDSATGDLHLAGTLHEENANNAPAPGSFAIRNKRGITLAWASQASGDLYIRGNVIPYRRSLE